VTRERAARPEPHCIGERRKCRIRHRPHELVHTDLPAEVGLGGGEVGVGLQQRELPVAEIHGRGERIGAGGGSGLELVQGDLELLLGTLQLRFSHAHELLLRERREEELLGGGGHLGPLVHELGVGCIRGGGRGARVGEATEAVEQVDARAHRAEVARVRRDRDDLARGRVVAVGGRLVGGAAQGERRQEGAGRRPLACSGVPLVAPGPDDGRLHVERAAHRLRERDLELCRLHGRGGGLLLGREGSPGRGQRRHDSPEHCASRRHHFFRPPDPVSAFSCSF